MAAASTKVGTKVGFKTSVHSKRYVGENLVTPAWYHGSREGHGNYMTGQMNGITVCDDTGKPVPFRQIGELK
jgi:hypothetical protein